MPASTNLPERAAAQPPSFAPNQQPKQTHITGRLCTVRSSNVTLITLTASPGAECCGYVPVPPGAAP